MRVSTLLPSSPSRRCTAPRTAGVSSSDQSSVSGPETRKAVAIDLVEREPAPSEMTYPIGKPR